MKRKLLKDIVVPAGTIFEDAPTRTERSPGCFVDAVIGLSDNTSGTITYDAGNDFPGELDVWFEDTE